MRKYIIKDEMEEVDREGLTKQKVLYNYKMKPIYESYRRLFS